MGKPTPWSSGFPSGQTLRACRVTHDWVEGTGKSGALTQDGVTWNEYGYSDGLTTAANNWGTPGGDYTLEDSSTVVVPPYPMTWTHLNMTVTNIVKGWASSAYPNFGFLIKLEDESGGYKGGVFNSREYGEEYGEAFVIKLEINYTVPTLTPTPTATGTSTNIIPPEVFYVAAGITSIMIIAVAVLILRKRQNRLGKSPPPPPPPPS